MLTGKQVLAAGAKLACLSLLLCTACSNLEPVNLPIETSAPPVESALWTELAQQREGDWFLPLNTGNEALEWRLRAINSASGSIDFQTFLWAEDDLGGEVSSALIAAAERGVAVRILLDDSFTMHQAAFLWALERHPLIEARIYNPFTYRPDNVLLRQLFNAGEFSRIDRRMHNKVLLADNRVLLIGGRNTANEYFGHNQQMNFRDLEVLAFGRTVQSVSASFDLYWNSGWAVPIAELEHYPAATTMVTAKPDQGVAVEAAELMTQEWFDAAAEAWSGQATLLVDLPASEGPVEDAPIQLGEQMLQWIERANKELIVVSAYLIPTPEVEQAIARAIARGVEVKVLTNSLRSNNHTAAHAAYRRHIATLLDMGVDVYEVWAYARDRAVYMSNKHPNAVLGLHAKFMLIDDDKSFIGSANLDARSLKLNTEIGLMIESRGLNQAVRGLIEQDFDPANAWLLRRNASGQIEWVGHDVILSSQPSDSLVYRLEDWFLGLLPIESEM